MLETAGIAAHFNHICFSLQQLTMKYLQLQRRMQRAGFHLLWLALLPLAWACNNEKRAETPDYADMSLFCDYRVTGSEESGQVTVLMQFRAGGADGPGLLLDTPAAVSLDGYLVQPDSSRMFGVYYEQRWLAHEFQGPHQVRYLTEAGDTLVEKFNYPQFRLVDSFPTRWKGDSLTLRINGLQDGDSLHLLMLDTAYASQGVDQYIVLTNSQLRIPASDFAGLKKGPVIFELYRETERDLRNGPELGGRLSTSYVIRRQFLLE